MATALFGLNYGQGISQVVVATGPATTTSDLEINIDLTKVTSREAARILIENIEDAMLQFNWPPT